jgi:23S rRNA pseudouridine2605 synthase
MPGQTTGPSPAQGGQRLVRLNKAIAMAGVCSRRGADELIATGLVTVNGRPAEAGTKVDPDRDVVEVRGKRVGLKSTEAPGNVYLMLHKPVRVVTTASDPQGRRTVLDLLPDALRAARPFPVGRLDFFSEGLLLLTSDGELAHRLTHPSHHLPKTYEVEVRGEADEARLAAMRRGMTLPAGSPGGQAERLAPAEVRVLRRTPGGAVLELVLIQGVNRQIRRMCQALDLTVLRLRRVRVGGLRLGELPPGAWRELTPKEVGDLRMAVGLDRPPE